MTSIPQSSSFKMKLNLQKDVVEKDTKNLPSNSVTCRNCKIQCFTECKCECHFLNCFECLAKTCDQNNCNCECHIKVKERQSRSIKNSSYLNRLKKNGVGNESSRSAEDKKNSLGNEYMNSDGEDGKKKNLFSKKITTNSNSNYAKRNFPRTGSIISAKTSQMEIISELTADDIEFANKMEAKVKKEQAQLKNNTNRKIFSKYSPIVLADQISEEEKMKMGLISDYKYKDLINDDDTGKMTAEQHKNLANLIAKRREENKNNVFKWSHKTKEKTDYEEKMLSKDFDIGMEEKVPEQEKKTLSNNLQRQFELSRISLPNPDRLENYREEKFIRDKSLLAKDAEFLNREIKHEKISDKKKLASSIFADIEKQESWQSYTTLLFADAEVESDKSNLAGGPTHKKSL